MLGSHVNKFKRTNIVFNIRKSGTSCASIQFIYFYFLPSEIVEPILQQILFLRCLILCNSTAVNALMYIAIIHLRPEVFHSVKLGDETKIGFPCFAFVILEKPKSPPEKNQRKVTTFMSDMSLLTLLSILTV